MINLDVLKNSLNGLGRTSKFVKDEYLFRPRVEDGEVQIRILPYKYTPENPFIQMSLHYGIGMTMRAIENDPITQFAARLKSMYSQSREYWEQGKRIEPKLRIFAPVLVRGHEQEGVKFWGFGKPAYEKIVSIILDPDYGDITDLNTGTDIKVTVKKIDGKKYPDIDIRVCRNSSPATTDPHVQQLIDNMVNIDDVFITPTYEQLAEQFKAYTSGQMSMPNLNPNQPVQNPIQQTQTVQQPVLQKPNVVQQTAQQPIQQATQQSTQQQDTPQQPQKTITESAKNVADSIDDSFWNALK